MIDDAWVLQALHASYREALLESAREATLADELPKTSTRARFAHWLHALANRLEPAPATA